MDNMDNIEKQAAQLGIIFTDNERTQATARARARVEAQSTEPATLADRMIALYPRLLASIASMGNVMITLTAQILISLGTPLALALLVFVEHERVMLGIMLFEPSHSLASLASWSLVILNVVLEFTVHYIESSNGYAPDPNHKASLRLSLARLGYWLGIVANWQPMPASPAQRERALLRLVTISILALALFGSMRDAISTQGGAWYEAIISIARDSTLSQFSVWVSGAIFALVAVLSAQTLARYVAHKASELMTSLPTTTPNHDLDTALQTEYALLLDAKLAKRNKATEPARPTLAQPTSPPNGHYGMMNNGHNGNNGHLIKE